MAFQAVTFILKEIKEIEIIKIIVAQRQCPHQINVFILCW
jgi:hypothetical protein